MYSFPELARAHGGGAGRLRQLAVDGGEVTGQHRARGEVLGGWGVARRVALLAHLAVRP